MKTPDDLRFGPDGLLPGIVQDGSDGRVLMLGYLDAEALAATLRSGEVHFHSRSRARLWRKGETSGNVLRLLDLAADCDGDALLLQVRPAGPTCHRGTRSCFDPAPSAATRSSAAARSSAAERGVGPGESAVESSVDSPGEPAAQHAAETAEGFAWLDQLWATIVARRTAADPASSYTARLLAGGVDAAARKVAEEATEVVLAAKDDAAAEASGAARSSTRSALAGEAADLVYHALVLLAERGLRPAQVIDRLRDRHRP